MELSHIETQNENKREVARAQVWIQEASIEANGSRSLPGEVCDLSRKGAAILLSQSLKSQTQVKGILNLPDNGWPVYCNATVVWCRASQEENGWPVAAGIEFIGLSLDDEARILTYLQRLGSSRQGLGRPH